MANVERPQDTPDDGQRSRRLIQRGNRLLVLNQALTNVLHDDAGGH